MLTRLSPDQLGELWPLIHRAIASSSIQLARMTEDRINQVVQSLVEGSATCWVHERGNTITTVVITTIVEEPVSKTKNLLIYCAHAFSKAKSDEYIKMAEDLKNYALQFDCLQILFYSSNEKLIKLMSQSGAFTDFTLIVFPIVKI